MLTNSVGGMRVPQPSTIADCRAARLIVIYMRRDYDARHDSPVQVSTVPFGQKKYDFASSGHPGCVRDTRHVVFAAVVCSTHSFARTMFRTGNVCASYAGRTTTYKSVVRDMFDTPHTKFVGALHTSPWFALPGHLRTRQVTV